MNMSHIVKVVELKLFAKFHDDWSEQSVSKATSPNYANYEVPHALIARVISRMAGMPSPLLV